MSAITLKSKEFYRVIYLVLAALTFIPLLIHTVYLLIAMENKIFIGRVLDFGSADSLSREYTGRFFFLLLLQDISIVVHFIWILVMAILLMINPKIPVKLALLGIFGLVLTILVIFLDPFGVIQYLSD